MTEIYIVRHCESMSNLNHFLAGQNDVDISERGAKQLECLSEYFKDIKFDKVYSSPLLRARKTAEAINKYSRAPMEINEKFIELGLGELDGKPVSDMKGEIKRIWDEEFYKFAAPNGESVKGVSKRVLEGFYEILRENEGKRIAVASHGGAIRCLLRQLKNLPEESIDEVMWCDNTGINKVVIADNGEILIEIENQICHLSEDVKSDSVSKWGKKKQ